MPRKTAHRTCQHGSGSVKMQRAYIRLGSSFIPVGWRCPDCRQFVNDSVPEHGEGSQ